MERNDKAPTKGSKVTEKEYIRTKEMLELGLSNTLASKISFRSQSVVSTVRHSENYEEYVQKSRTRLRKRSATKTQKTTVTGGISVAQIPMEQLNALKDLGGAVEAKDAKKAVPTESMRPLDDYTMFQVVDLLTSINDNLNLIHNDNQRLLRLVDGRKRRFF